MSDSEHGLRQGDIARERIAARMAQQQAPSDDAKPYTREELASIQAEWETGVLAGGMARSTIGRLLVTARAGLADTLDAERYRAVRENAAVNRDPIVHTAWFCTGEVMIAAGAPLPSVDEVADIYRTAPRLDDVTKRSGSVPNDFRETP